MLELVHRIGSMTAEVLDRILIAEPVGALDGVVHVPAPIVGPHVAKSRGNSALRRHRMRPRRKDLGDARRLETGFGTAKRRPQASATRTDDHDIVRIIDDRVSLTAHRRRNSLSAAGLAIRCRHQAQAPKLNFKTAKMLASATKAAKNVLSISAAIFSPSLCT